MAALRRSLSGVPHPVVGGLLAVALAGCVAPPALPSSCQATTNCGDLGEVLSCCTLTQCEYRLTGGTSFACAGTDCTAAHARVAAYCDPHCPDAWTPADAWYPDRDAGADANVDAAMDAGPSLDAQPCVR